MSSGADGEPGRQAGDVRGEEILAADGDAHGKDAAQQNAVGRLRAGAVDGSYLNAEVVGDGLWRSRCCCFALRGRGAGVGGRHGGGVPFRSKVERCSLFLQVPLYRDGQQGCPVG